MIDPKALKALSYFTLAKLEQIWRDYFDYDDDIDIFEGQKQIENLRSLISMSNNFKDY